MQQRYELPLVNEYETDTTLERGMSGGTLVPTTSGNTS
jgi:hypothetical protein